MLIMINTDFVFLLWKIAKKRDVTDIERCRRNTIFRVYTIHVTVEANVSYIVDLQKYPV